MGYGGFGHNGGARRKADYGTFYFLRLCAISRQYFFVRKKRVVNTTNQLAEDIKNSFELEELNKEIISKMNRAVAIETGSINVGVFAFLSERGHKNKSG